MVISKIPVDELLDARARQTIAAGIWRGCMCALLETCARLNSISEIGLLTCGAGRDTERERERAPQEEEQENYLLIRRSRCIELHAAQSKHRLPCCERERECKTHTCARGVLHNLRARLSLIYRPEPPLISLVCPRACKFCSITFTTLKWMLVKLQFSHFWWALHHFGAKT